MRAVGLRLGNTLATLVSASLVLSTVPAYAEQPAPAPPPSPVQSSGADAPKRDENQPDAKKDAEAVKEVKDAKAAIAAAPTPPEGKVFVHLEAPQEVTLERRQGAASPWEHVCNSPCDEAVSVRDEYHIVGVNMTESKPFMVDGKESKTTLYVHPGYHKDVVTGEWVLGGAGALAVGGILSLAIGAGTHTPLSNDGITHNGNTDWITVGMVLLVGAAATGIYGGAMVVNNLHTSVNGGTAKPADVDEKKAPPSSVNVQLSASRQPTYREAANVPQPATFTMPILSGRF